MNKSIRKLFFLLSSVVWPPTDADYFLLVADQSSDSWEPSPQSHALLSIDEERVLFVGNLSLQFSPSAHQVRSALIGLVQLVIQGSYRRFDLFNFFQQSENNIRYF